MVERGASEVKTAFTLPGLESEFRFVIEGLSDYIRGDFL